MKEKYVFTDTSIRAHVGMGDVTTSVMGVYDTKKEAIKALEKVTNNMLAIYPVHESGFHCVRSLIVEKEDCKIICDVIADNLMGAENVFMQQHVLGIRPVVW